MVKDLVTALLRLVAILFVVYGLTEAVYAVLVHLTAPSEIDEYAHMMFSSIGAPAIAYIIAGTTLFVVAAFLSSLVLKGVSNLDIATISLNRSDLERAGLFLIGVWFILEGLVDLSYDLPTLWDHIRHKAGNNSVLPGMLTDTGFTISGIISLLLGAVAMFASRKR